MHAQISASLHHLKQALSHLHNAKLIIEPADKVAAQSIEELVRATQSQIKRLEQLSGAES